MTNLGASLISLRSAYGQARNQLEGPAVQQLDLCERLLEELAPSALRLKVTQDTLAFLIEGLPAGREIDRWRNRAGVHLYHSCVGVMEPLYSKLFLLEVPA